MAISVTGAKEIASIFARAPASVEKELRKAMSQQANAVLGDMKSMTPVDPKNTNGRHARDGLRVQEDTDNPQRIVFRIGLPKERDTLAYYWFRFIDLGTKGGTYKARRIRNGVRQEYMINVPARPAMNIRARSIDANITNIERSISAAIRKGLRDA